MSDESGVDADLASDEQPLPAADQTDAGPDRQPDWWHRDHPTFTAISGFFA